MASPFLDSSMVIFSLLLRTNMSVAWHGTSRDSARRILSFFEMYASYCLPLSLYSLTRRSLVHVGGFETTSTSRTLVSQLALNSFPSSKKKEVFPKKSN